MFKDEFVMTTQSHPPVIPLCQKERPCEKTKATRFAAFASPPCPYPPITGLSSSKPVWGVKSEKGKRSKMEDTFTVREDFLKFNGIKHSLHSRFPSSMDFDSVSMLSLDDNDCSKTAGTLLQRDSFHFYGVYDGHGGMEASKHCAERMHENIQTVWNNLLSIDREICDSSSDEECMNETDEDMMTDAVVDMFTKAFKITDDEFKEMSENSAIMGSTAVTALVSNNYLILGYCGDSRAVLCRNKKAYALTVDHKPERDDETERVQNAGGQVLYFNGPRVMGLLAMSRAIGDNSLRPYVIPTPEVCIIHRTDEDELLIMATDGLWDVVTNQEACTLALKCLERAKEKGIAPKDAAKLTAAVLTKAAMERGSRDNITIVVIDLRYKDEFVQSVPSAENDL